MVCFKCVIVGILNKDEKIVIRVAITVRFIFMHENISNSNTIRFRF
jgi:hypothetical protein